MQCFTNGTLLTATCVNGDCVQDVCLCREGFRHDDFWYMNRRCSLSQDAFTVMVYLVAASNFSTAVFLIWRLFRQGSGSREAGDIVLAVKFGIVTTMLCTLFALLRLIESIPLHYSFSLVTSATGLNICEGYMVLQALIRPLARMLKMPYEELRPRFIVFLPAGILLVRVAFAAILFASSGSKKLFDFVFFAHFMAMTLESCVVIWFLHIVTQKMFEYAKDVSSNVPGQSNVRLQRFFNRLGRLRKMYLWLIASLFSTTILTMGLARFYGIIPWSSASYTAMSVLITPAVSIIVSLMMVKSKVSKADADRPSSVLGGSRSSAAIVSKGVATR